MKTSNKLLLTAVLIFIGTLILHNVALTTAYYKGDFRDPFIDFISLNNKNFSAITVNGASMLNVEIVPGDYQVRVHKNYEDYITVTQRGSEIIVDLDFPAKQNVTTSGTHLIISSPDLAVLKTDAVYTLAGNKITRKVVHDTFMMKQHYVKIKGMELDSLTILQDNASAVLLEGNKIGSLHATTGISAGSSPKLHLIKGNVISKANLNIQQNSQLVLDDVALPNLTYTFSDFAKTTISGASLSVLKQ